MEQTIEPGLLKGTIQIPSSKSDAQRLILAAALAQGVSTIENIGTSNDEKQMLDSIQALGAKVKLSEDRSAEIEGITEFRKNIKLNCGESGLGLRLLTSICATLNHECMIEGEGTLLSRPMTFFDELFKELGVEFSSKNGYLPFKIKGPLNAVEFSVDGSQSSQFISGLLMALPLVNGTSYLHVKDATSTPYIQMTLNTLNTFGIEINHQNYSDYIIPGNQRYLPTTKIVEGDWSSASYWLVASALGCEINVKGLSMSSLQADKKILNAFVAASCVVLNTVEGISIDGTNRKPLDFDATHCPDLFPALVTFAALTEGVSKISGVHRLKHKESNRGEVLLKEFSKLGVLIEIENDTFLIHGNRTISGGKVDSNNDHRIAMCLAIAGLFSSEKIIITSAEAVSKSYTDFWQDLNSLENL